MPFCAKLDQGDFERLLVPQAPACMGRGGAHTSNITHIGPILSRDMNHDLFLNAAHVDVSAMFGWLSHHSLRFCKHIKNTMKQNSTTPTILLHHHSTPYSQNYFCFSLPDRESFVLTFILSKLCTNF
jgi:hypothetical protein